MKRIKIISVFLCIALILSPTVLLSGCDSGNGEQTDLMAKVTPSAEIQQPNEDFVNSYLSFSVELLKSTAKNSENNNILISPLSTAAVLGMLANGAKGDTLKEIENVLADGMSISEYNKYMRGYTFNLASGENFKFKNASAVWFNNLDVKQSFLQTNKDYYGISAYKQNFDDTALQNINNWVNENTDGTIDKMLDELDPQLKILIINTILFDAKWEKIYPDYDVEDGEFTAIDGSKRVVKMMESIEQYLVCSWGQGFEKSYAGGKYNFIAVIPSEEKLDEVGGDFYSHLEKFDAEAFKFLLKSGSPSSREKMYFPKYEYEFETSFAEELKGMGINSIFDAEKAELSGISKDELTITEFKQKTYISVNEEGTKASAATYSGGALGAGSYSREIFFNRPFIYMIVDTTSELPIFMGVVADIGQ